MNRNILQVAAQAVSVICFPLCFELRTYEKTGSINLMKLTNVTMEEIQRAEESLNHKLRKVLGFSTHFWGMFGKSMR